MDTQQLGGFINIPGAPDFVMTLVPIFILVAIWSIVWKGLGLWHAARRKEPVWFVVLLLINTAGILEIVYLFLVAKVKVKDLFSSR